MTFCIICGWDVPDSESFDQHTENCHPLWCGIDDMRFKTHKEFEKHIKKEHPDVFSA